MWKKTVKFFREVKVELMKVNLPSKKGLWMSTLIVIIFSVIIAVYLWVLDLIFSKSLLLIAR